MANDPTEFLSRTGYRRVNASSAGASTLTGNTLAPNVLFSSLTSVGTLVNLTVTNPISGSITGNAATVTTNANLTGPVTSIGNATAIAASINLPGSPTTTTQVASDNSTKIATTAQVQSAILAALNGLTIVITTAALTGGGTQGSMTFTNGLLTAQVPAT